jgi:WD40 repeat protein
MNGPPRSPYKGLAAFGDSALDAMLFFGREGEREAIVANVLASRLTVLHGPSGVGKSSLLRAGVAQRLRALADGAAVVVHDSWADDPVAGVIESISGACPGLGPTAGLADTVAAALERTGEIYLLLDQFEEYFLYHGADGPLREALPELLRRPGLRVSVLIALRSDALAELDTFAVALPELFANLLRLDPLDRRAARAAIVGPLERYGELTDATYHAEPELIEAALDEIATGRVEFSGAASTPNDDVEAPYLQLVLERLWNEEQAGGSHVLRLDTFRRLGGADAIVRDHVHGTLAQLPAATEDAAASVVRQLVTPSGAKISHTVADLAEYTRVDAREMRPLLETLVHERLVRAVDGAAGGVTRYEIFHDVLAEPLLAWRSGYQLERERIAARRQRRRLLLLSAAAFAALAVVAAIAAFALVQRSTARSEARNAHARELVAQALASMPTDPAGSLASALEAAEIEPGTQTEDVLRSTLVAMREQRVIHVGGSVVAAGFAPNRAVLLIAGSNGTAGLYDHNGTRLVQLARTSAYTRAAWSQDGVLHATGDASGTVRIYGRTTRVVDAYGPVVALSFSGHRVVIGSGRRVQIVDGLDGPIREVVMNGAVAASVLSPNGSLLAIAGRRAGQVTTEIRDSRTGHVRATLPERGIGSMSFSADGRLLVTGSTDGTARLWTAATGRLLHTLTMQGHVLTEQFSPDGKSLVTSSTDGTAALWDVRTGVRVLLLVGATGVAEAAAFSPDGKQITVGFGDRFARIYSTQDGRLLATLAGHEDAVTSVGYDPTGLQIATGSDDGTVRLWSANAGDQLAPIDRRRSSVYALFAGARVLTFEGRGSDARVLSRDGQLVKRLWLPGWITAAAAHGGSIALADNIGGGLQLATVSGPSGMYAVLGVVALAYAPDGTLVTGSSDGTIRIWKRGVQTALVQGLDPVASVSAANSRFIVATTTGSTRVYDYEGHRQAEFNARAEHAALKPTGEVAATTSGRKAYLWDATTGELLHRLTGHGSTITDVEFSPDGTRVVTASYDHDSRIWDVRSGRLLHVLRGHFFAVRSASFSPDGRWIVTSSQFTAGLWNATTGQLVLYLSGHTLPLTGAAFSPAGNWILTGSRDGTARIVRCDICRSLPGLEQLARERLRAVG